jgi:hypothetical protein
MSRSFALATLTASLIPVLATAAAATPYSPYYGYGSARTACSVDSYSVERGKNYILVRNTTGRVIPQGARIELTIYMGGYRITRKHETAWKMVGKGTDSITFAQPEGATRCSARVFFR